MSAAMSDRDEIREAILDPERRAKIEEHLTRMHELAMEHARAAVEEHQATDRALAIQHKYKAVEWELRVLLGVQK